MNPRFFKILLLLAVLLAPVIAHGLVSNLSGATICPLKRVSGISCPFCGSSRSLAAVMDGRPLEAWMWNPLLSMLWLWCLIYAVCDLMPGQWRRCRQVSDTSRQIAQFLAGKGWWIAGVIILVNWFYVNAIG